MGNGGETKVKVVYVYDPGVLGVIISEHTEHIVVKYYLDEIMHIEALVDDEYIAYGEMGGMDV